MLFSSGTIKRRWRPSSVDSRCDIEVVMKANHILVTNEQRNSVVVNQDLVMDKYFTTVLYYLLICLKGRLPYLPFYSPTVMLPGMGVGGVHLISV